MSPDGETAHHGNGRSVFCIAFFRARRCFSSLIRSAQRHGLNVEHYLRSVFAHLPGTKLSELWHLLPDIWKQELAAEEAQAQTTL